MDTSDGVDIWAGVTPCAAHQPNIDPDCDHCKAEITAREAVMDQLQAEGETRSKGLGVKGVALPREVFQYIRMDLMIEAAFQDPRQRLLFEGEYGRRVCEMLKEAHREVDSQQVAPKPNIQVVKDMNGVKG